MMIRFGRESAPSRNGLKRLSVDMVHHFPMSDLWRGAVASASRLVRELRAEHRPAALRLRLGRFVLQDVPMLDQLAVGDANNIGGDPASRSSVTGKSAMDDHEI